MEYIVATIEQVLFCLQQHGLLNGIEMLHLTKCCRK